ncbi:MAG: YraN family protein [Firmicutes bacterium]|nr:YraN family protein [Bacillota bacterium]
MTTAAGGEGSGEDRVAFGRRAEAAAAAAAEARGYRVVGRNWRCRAGELDLVVKDGDTWVAVEVRARRTRAAGTPAESVTPAKRGRLVRAARWFAAAHGCLDAPWRFDVCAVTVERGRLAVEWIEDAFAAGD